MSDNIIVKQQNVPTYLRTLLNEDKMCTLIHSKKAPKKRSYNSDSSENICNESMGSECDSDLTGNPLQIDLNLTEINIETETTGYNWPLEEYHHYPLNLDKARQLLNEEFNPKVSNVPTFCVTDASDDDKTVIIGSQNSFDGISTYMVQVVDNGLILELLSADSNLPQTLQQESNKLMHLKPFKIMYKVRKVYQIRGPSIEDSLNLDVSKNQGCIFLETSWNTIQIEEPDHDEIELKFIMKVISGHADSKIRYLWNELVHLQKLINVVTIQELDENLVLSPDSRTLISDVVNNIGQVFRNVVNVVNQEKITSINFSKLVRETHLDKLWEFLKECCTLKDLQCFWSVFLNTPIIGSIIVGHEDLKTVLKPFLNGNNTRLSRSESLKLMIEIGFQKLKRDYFTIINYYYPLQETVLKTQWNSKDKSMSEDRLKFLIKLHTAAELLAYLENSHFHSSKKNLNIILEQIHDRHLKETNTKELLEMQLLKIVCYLNADHDTFFTKRTPLSTSLEVDSYLHMRKLRTIFHVSQHPLFPPAIYQDRSSIENSEDCKQAFVSKMYIFSTLKKEQ